MAKINPYLNFDGNAEEAFNFYKSVIGGEFSNVQKFKDMPGSEKIIPAKVIQVGITNYFLQQSNRTLRNFCDHDQLNNFRLILVGK